MSAQGLDGVGCVLVIVVGSSDQSITKPYDVETEMSLRSGEKRQAE